jgi:hypothetical protein
MKAVQFGGTKHEGYQTRKHSGNEWNPLHAGGGSGVTGHSGNTLANGTTLVTANKRSVWHIATQPRKEAHFATFPDAIPEICIKAGTSQKGQCEKCGSPWERQTEHIKGEHNHDASLDQRARTNTKSGGTESTTIGSARQGSNLTIGWQPTCDCNAPTVPQTVLDPFGGSGTTAQVAKRLGREFIIIELNPKYVKDLIEPGLENINPLFPETPAMKEEK